MFFFQILLLTILCYSMFEVKYFQIRQQIKNIEKVILLFRGTIHIYVIKKKKRKRVFFSFFDYFSCVCIRPNHVGITFLLYMFHEKQTVPLDTVKNFFSKYLIFPFYHFPIIAIFPRQIKCYI